MAVASNNTTLTPKPALPPAADPATAETRKAAERSGLKGEQGLKQYQDSVRRALEGGSLGLDGKGDIGTAPANGKLNGNIDGRAGIDNADVEAFAKNSNALDDDPEIKKAADRYGKNPTDFTNTTLERLRTGQLGLDNTGQWGQTKAGGLNGDVNHDGHINKDDVSAFAKDGNQRSEPGPLMRAEAKRLGVDVKVYAETMVDELRAGIQGVGADGQAGYSTTHTKGQFNGNINGDRWVDYHDVEAYLAQAAKQKPTF
jgi:hypothetical protein